MLNIEVRKTWDKVMSNLKEIKSENDPNLSYIYFLVKTPMGTSDRDFVVTQKVKKDFPKPG